MRSTQMSIRGHTYFMSPGQDVSALKLVLVAAVRAGGNIVQFRSFDDKNEVELLVSPGILIEFRTKPPSSIEPESKEDIERMGRIMSWDEF